MSKNDPVVSDVADDQRASFPVAPPVSVDVIPSVFVAVQIVDVPVERSTMPFVPEALVESNNVPVNVRNDVDALRVRNSELVVPEAVPKYRLDAVRPVADALVSTERPDTVIFDDEALVSTDVEAYTFTELMFVVEAVVA